MEAVIALIVIGLFLFAIVAIPIGLIKAIADAMQEAKKKKKQKAREQREIRSVEQTDELLDEIRALRKEVEKLKGRE